MAKPQVENGHTQIANEILEHLIKLHLSPNQWQVLLCIIRKTSGFHKKVDYIANSQIVTATGLCKAVVSRCLHSLTGMRVITHNGKSIGFQEDWEQWQKLAIPSTISPTEEVSSLVNSTPEVSSIANNEKLAIPSTELAIRSSQLAESSTKVSSCAVAQKKKETITKETIQKKGPTKRKYGEFQNILLTDEEYRKLITKLGEVDTLRWIEELSGGIESKGYKFLSHYATILNWERRDREKQNGGQDGKSRRSPQSVLRPGEYTDPKSL